MKSTRTGKRRAAAINSIKVLLTSAYLAATLGGWVVISAASRSTATVAPVSVNATVQTVADTSLVAPLGAATSAATAASSTQTSAVSAAGPSTPATAAVTAAAPATVAPPASAVPTQVVVQTKITTHSS